MDADTEKRLAEIESWQDQEDDGDVIDRVTLDEGVVPWLCELVRKQDAERETLVHLCDSLYAELTSNPDWHHDGIRKAVADLPKHVRCFLTEK